MKKNILITGGSGLLGLGLYLTKPSEFNCYFTYFNDHTTASLIGMGFYKLDITNKNAVETFITEKNIDFIIHAASLGNIDYCEKNQKVAKKINIGSTEILYNLSQKYKFKIIYISSNAIFDGNDAPYDESSQANPQNYYGYTKQESERIVLQDKSNLVIRLLLLFGWNAATQRLNPMTWVINELSKGNSMNVVDDIYNNPISNIEAAQVIWKLLKKDTTGIVNLAGKDRVSRYEFARLVTSVFNLDPTLLNKVSSDFFPEITKRMPDTTYNIEKVKKITGFNPLPLRESLQYLKKNKPIWIKESQFL